MHRLLLLMTASILALVTAFAFLSRDIESPAASDSGDSATQQRSQVMFFCAASNRGVMEEILADYREETGRQVEIQYGASQTLLAQMEASGRGDLYLPADDSYLEMAREKGLVKEILPVARMQGVVAVAKGNPKSIDSFKDLLDPETTLVQANPDAAAIGKLTRKLLRESGLWEQLDEATTAYRTTVTEAANDVVVGAADAAIVYDAVLHTYPDLTYVEIPELKEAASDVSIGVIADTDHPADALHFARYVSARDRGQQHYRQHGFRVVEGDVWSDVPEIKLFAGSMLRPALEETLMEFEQREGVRIDRVYNGCGILVAQMQAGQVPDAYFACDTEFMEQVPDLFPESIDVSQNELAILVQKGNPKNITSLSDLRRKDLRVGIGHEKQCAMGWLTQNTFRESGIQQEVMSNVTVQTPTGDMLVNQLQTGSLDAAVAYLSNAAGAADFVDAIRIEGLKCSIATQPYAVAESSPNANTLGRLLDRICSMESQASFAAEGFGWKAETSFANANE